MLFVLLTPCIDCVVTFSHLGRADARLLLAATPTLLILQMLLLPVYLRLFLGEEAGALVQPSPFVHAWTSAGLSLLPVPATALVLFIVVAAVLSQLGPATAAAAGVVPHYIGIAIAAPLIGWGIGRLFRLDAVAGRAVAFSAGTRNSLVVLPLALAVPGAISVLPAIIVTQTLVELIGELSMCG